MRSEDSTASDQIHSIRRERPVRGIAQTEILFHKKDDEGSGRFLILVESAALHGTSKVATVLAGKAVRIAFSINPVQREYLVLLGGKTPDGRDHQRLGKLPPNLDGNGPHEFEVIFKHWQIVQVSVNGKPDGDSLPRDGYSND